LLGKELMIGFRQINQPDTYSFFLELLAAIITSALSGLFKYENGPVPRIRRFFSIFAPALIPEVFIITPVFHTFFLQHIKFCYDFA